MAKSVSVTLDRRAFITREALTIVVLIGVLSRTALAHDNTIGAPEERQSDTSSPRVTCTVDPMPKPIWTEFEQWAWTQICKGDVANFNERENALWLDPKKPTQDNEWKDDRVLSSRFLETILLSEPFRTAIPRQGVRIVGAYFPSVDEDLTVSSGSLLTFTPENWDTPQTVTVSAAPDDDGTHGTATFEHTAVSSDSDYDEIPISCIIASENDDDAVGVWFSEPTVSSDGMSIEGSLVEYTLGLRTQPAAGVVITLARTNDSDSNLKVGPRTLVFTKDNWNIPQTVTISLGADVSRIEGTATFTHTVDSADANYDNIPISDSMVAVTSQDLDLSPSKHYVLEFGSLEGTAIVPKFKFSSGRQCTSSASIMETKVGVTVSNTRLNVDEGSSMTYTVVLNGRPSGDVMIGVARSSPIDLTDAFIERPLIIHASRLDSEVEMARLTTPSVISFDGSKVGGLLNMQFASIKKGLFMRDGEYSDVNLHYADIATSLSIDDSVFTSKLDIGAASVGGTLWMRRAQFFEVDFTGVKAGFIQMLHSIFYGALIMYTASIENDLVMAEVPRFGDVMLTGSTIGSQVAMNDSVFEGKLDMDFVSVGRNLSIQRATLLDAVDINGAQISSTVVIYDSVFAGKLKTSVATIGNGLVIHRGRFSEVDLTGSKIGFVEILHSTFDGLLDMSSVSIGNDLVMAEVAKFGDVDLRAATIGSQVGMNDSVFEGDLEMGSVSVGRSLSMERATIRGDVDMERAKVGTDFSIVGATFEGELDMDSVSIGGNLAMARSGLFGDVGLAVATIGTDVWMEGSLFKGEVDIQSASIGSNLGAEGATFEGTVKGQAVAIGANLDVRGAKLTHMDLTGARVDGDLRLGDLPVRRCGENPREWCEFVWVRNGSVPKLALRDTRVGVLRYTKDTWDGDPELNLNGFTYEHIDGYDTSEYSLEELEHPIQRGSAGFIGWLAMDVSNSAQPYLHLAGVLRTSGYGDLAEDILFANRERERAQLDRSQGKWWFLSALKIFIGYGYGIRYFRALAWVGGLIVVGTFVLYLFGERRIDRRTRRTMYHLDSVFYSLDMLLPVIHLRELHYTEEADLRTVARYYFYFHKVMGYVLVFFVIAGLSGITE